MLPSDSVVPPSQELPPIPEGRERDARGKAGIPVDAIKSRIAGALVAAIRKISKESDRDEVLRWFINARQILASGGTRPEVARSLYDSVDTKRFAKLLGGVALTTVRNYKDSRLPLAIKVSLPVAAVGTAMFGLQGAGLVAFGGGVGVPVVLILFLGVAGVTSVVEAFTRDQSVRDPLTKLLLTLVAFETARRARKELLDVLRAEAVIPSRQDVPTERQELLQHLLTMDPSAFERHVMSFFEPLGHPVGVTPKGNDFGVDGYVLHPDGVLIVQCKRYNVDNPVGRPLVQQFKGVIEEQRALKGYIVTTGRFTAGAVECAGLSNRVLLVDGDELLRWHECGGIPKRAGSEKIV